MAMSSSTSTTFSSDAAMDTYISGLKNAHALEKQAIQLMERQVERIEHYPEIEQLLRGVPGFRAYYALRAGDGTVATVTVCDDQAGTAESTRRAAEWVRQNMSGASISPPEVTEGETFLNF